MSFLGADASAGAFAASTVRFGCDRVPGLVSSPAADTNTAPAWSPSIPSQFVSRKGGSGASAAPGWTAPSLGAQSDTSGVPSASVSLGPAGGPPPEPAPPWAPPEPPPDGPPPELPPPPGPGAGPGSDTICTLLREAPQLLPSFVSFTLWVSSAQASR